MMMTIKKLIWLGLTYIDPLYQTDEYRVYIFVALCYEVGTPYYVVMCVCVDDDDKRAYLVRTNVYRSVVSH
jgi:hypothetical protein